MRKSIVTLSVLALCCSLYVSTAAGQVVRESGVSSIAGILFAPEQPASWRVRSAGGEILFASLSADVYRAQTEHDEGYETATEEEGGGCSDEDAGSPFKFYVEVADSRGDILCKATRPAPPPGWQRDPRLACVLPPSSVQLVYTITVGLEPSDHAEEQPHAMSDATPEPHPFLLDVSLRRIAETGTLIQPAVAQSRNRL
jgi:hypothetical protein